MRTFMANLTIPSLLLRRKHPGAILVLLWATWLLAPDAALATFKTVLQGQDAGITNWVNGPLHGWQELDVIPVRTLSTGGPATNQIITVNFDHTKSLTIPGIEDLTGFSNSANVIITSPPILSAPSGVDIWNYTFTITVTDAQNATVQFNARLAAGAHGFPGSSLNLSLPGPGQLQINKPGAVLGSPDMALTKTGPSEAKTNQIITYVINYTNKLIAADAALGVQVSDVLPPQVSYVPGSGSKGIHVVGNRISWDLGKLVPGKRGILTYKVIVTNN